jgi:hypothetical protein
MHVTKNDANSIVEVLQAHSTQIATLICSFLIDNFSQEV